MPKTKTMEFQHSGETRDVQVNINRKLREICTGKKGKKKEANS